MADPSPGEPSDIPLGDILSEVPLLREIQRVLMASRGPVNWELARQVGIAVASWGSDDPQPTDQDRQGLADAVRVAELAVADFTGLPQPTDLARVEAFRRTDWVEANAKSLRQMVNLVAGRLAHALAEHPGPSVPSMPDDEESDGDQLMELVMHRMMPLLMGAQVGGVLGYLGQRVLGQYDLAVPRDGGSLYFVVPNIAGFEHDWSLDPREFRAYVALHEVTHRFEFARPWAGHHLMHLIHDVVHHAEIDLSGIEERLESLDFADPEALSRAFESMNDVFGSSEDPEQRLRIARVQAFMAAAEGYGDHVMESVGRKMLGSLVQIEEALNRYREGRHGEQALERLLGVEMKLEQYRLGRAFCSRVSELTDEATLARMWESPESLPSLPELEEPTLWLSRMT